MTRISVALVLLLTGCASAEHRAQLDAYQQGCARGDPGACMMVPVQAGANAAEANENAGTAAAIVLVPLVLLGAFAVGYAGARYPAPVASPGVLVVVQ